MELHLYDFDGTLFRAPDRPPWWGRSTWIMQSPSLGPPCVPQKPGSEWWVGSAVSDAKASIGNPDVWAILCTGRALGSSHRFRVPELLKQKGLNFDEVYLNPGGDTKTYKIKVILGILRRHPDIDTVQIWENHLSNMTAFCKAVEATGRACIPHPIKARAPDPVCTEDQMEQLEAEGWIKRRRAQRVALAYLERLAAYDPEAWYYDHEPGMTLQTVFDRWQKDRPGVGSRGRPLPRQKATERSMPVMLTVRELWPLREYTWTRKNSREGPAMVGGKEIRLPGPVKWDALLADMQKRGWDRTDPLILYIGAKGGVKVAEGNHRLAVAKALGMSKVPVRFFFSSSRVRKEPREEPVEVSPKAIEKVLEEAEPTTPKEQERFDKLMKLLGM